MPDHESTNAKARRTVAGAAAPAATILEPLGDGLPTRSADPSRDGSK